MSDFIVNIPSANEIKKSITDLRSGVSGVVLDESAEFSVKIDSGSSLGNKIQALQDIDTSDQPTQVDRKSVV